MVAGENITSAVDILGLIVKYAISIFNMTENQDSQVTFVSVLIHFKFLNILVKKNKCKYRVQKKFLKYKQQNYYYGIIL